jgi:hypothetical protein
VLESKAIKFSRYFDKQTSHENNFLEEKNERSFTELLSLGDTYKVLRVLSIRRG